ncbi:MAG TPA: DNA photolyase [Gammaproteobacteria bacterium]|nr:DNA photolyase [Gammaproteobacteria bacterium]
MIDTLYIEEEVLDHPRARAIGARFPRAARVICQRYGELFNRKAQNFRLQKARPALILAKKHGQLLQPAPPQYGIGGRHHFYFSHMLNCLYDCRYCFLQGMYRSAHYVVFVNFEDFQQAIEAQTRALEGEDVQFYSGYDCDSLALDPVTRFTESFLPLFATLPDSSIELRTKSTQIRGLLKMAPLPNCVVAFSFVPQDLGRALEHGVPPLERRLDAMLRLHRQGWPLGLRFDPLIYHPDYAQTYRALFDTLFTRIPPEALHSVSLGAFRMPETFFRNMVRLYPDERFFAGPFANRDGMTSYQRHLEQDMMRTCAAQILEYVPAEKFFPCDDEYR